MKPWQVSVGVTTSAVGLAVILGGEELSYLPWSLVLPHWPTITLYAFLAVASFGAVIYLLARVLGLAQLGRQAGLAERAVRRGQGDPDLAEALQREAEGKFR